MWEPEEGSRNKIILASASPRRKEVLEILRLDFEVVKPVGCSEKLKDDPYRTVVENSVDKAKSVLGHLREGSYGGSCHYKPDSVSGSIVEESLEIPGGDDLRLDTPDSCGSYSERGTRYLIAGFDTIVSVDGRLLGKPRDLEEACRFIELLSGRVHEVISGVCILDGFSGKYEYETETTRVKFRTLDKAQVLDYLKAGEVLDKAGAYNIAGFGSILVEKIDGCFFNVAGLPVFKFVSLLDRFGYKVIG
jgi:MAF protein